MTEAGMVTSLLLYAYLAGVIGAAVGLLIAARASEEVAQIADDSGLGRRTWALACGAAWPVLLYRWFGPRS